MRFTKSNFICHSIWLGGSTVALWYVIYFRIGRSMIQILIKTKNLLNWKCCSIFEQNMNHIASPWSMVWPTNGCSSCRLLVENICFTTHGAYNVGEYQNLNFFWPILFCPSWDKWVQISWQTDRQTDGQTDKFFDTIHRCVWIFSSS